MCSDSPYLRGWLSGHDSPPSQTIINRAAHWLGGSGSQSFPGEQTKLRLERGLASGSFRSLLGGWGGC